MIFFFKCHSVRKEVNATKMYKSVKRPPFDLQGVGGGGWSIFEINNSGQTLHEINNLLQ